MKCTLGAYDVLVSTGSMVEGQLKCDTLPEMIRCVKTGMTMVLPSFLKLTVITELLRTGNSHSK